MANDTNEMIVTTDESNMQPSTFAWKIFGRVIGVRTSVSSVPRSLSPTKLLAAVTLDVMSGIMRKNIGNIVFVMT